ncbi:MAG: TolC family protein [Porphyromonadaceae bacterium]|nr:TolC family protein [Porphyromonadaceae bacterium]
MKRLILIISLLSWRGVCATDAQSQAKRLTLGDAITLAHRQSVDAAVALGELRSAYWEYRSYRANLLPEVSLEMTLPDYQQRYNLHQREDGTLTFVRSNALRMMGDLSINQNIWPTGGKLSLNSSLQYIDPLATAGARRSFLSVPIGLTYWQPIFATNKLKWHRRIEPIRYEEAKARYLEQVDQVTLRAIQMYFELLVATENKKIAEQNKANAERIYEIAQARRQMGQISENELLQLKLSTLKAQSNLTQEQSALNGAMFRLRSFLSLSESERIEAETPKAEAYPPILYQEVLDKALTNGSFARNIRRRQLEADFQLAQARGERQEINLYASVGYTGRDEYLRNAYNHVVDNQIVQVGIKIPLLDWGKRKGRVRVAKSNQEVMRAKLKQEEMDFSQDLYLLVERYNNQTEQLRIAHEADAIAQRRYATSVESFMIGKINTLDLNDAQISKDQARAKYLQEMHLYWHYFYQIRSLTLYDFAEGKPLELSIHGLLTP